MIKFTYKSWPHDYSCTRASLRDKYKEGDILIDIPFLSYNQEQYAVIEYYGHPELDCGGLNIGNVRNIRINCRCIPGKLIPKGGLLYPNCEFVPEPIREYVVEMTLQDNDNKFRHFVIKVTNVFYLLHVIQQYINPLLEDGHTVNSFNYEWINWQCTTWNSSEANGQGRNFTFEDKDFYSIDDLYDYLCSFDIKVISNAVSKRGGGYYWKDIYVSFENIDRYVNTLISKALSTIAKVNDDKVSFKIVIENEERDGYCHEGERELSPTEAESYRGMIVKKLLIYVLREFDIELMKRNRFIK